MPYKDPEKEREYRRKRAAEYRRLYPERYQKAAREYAKRNPERKKQSYAAWYEKNAEQQRARQRKYYQDNRCEIAQKAQSITVREQQRRYRENNPQKRHEGALLRKYGLTLSQYQRMLVQQRGLCAICHEAPAEHVDHNHLTKQIRALLCNGCNTGIGHLREREDIFHSAVEYLRTYGANPTFYEPKEDCETAAPDQPAETQLSIFIELRS